MIAIELNLEIRNIVAILRIILTQYLKKVTEEKFFFLQL